MLHLLSAGNKSGVQNLRSLDLFHHLTSLIDEAVHRLATSTASRRTKARESVL